MNYIRLNANETIFDFVLKHAQDRVVGFIYLHTIPSDCPENEEFFIVTEKDNDRSRIKVILIPFESRNKYFYVRSIHAERWIDSDWTKLDYDLKSKIPFSNVKKVQFGSSSNNPIQMYFFINDDGTESYRMYVNSAGEIIFTHNINGTDTTIRRI